MALARADPDHPASERVLNCGWRRVFCRPY
jgi:hypothetical protein